MELFNIQIVESIDLPADEAWIIYHRDAPQIPQSMKATLAMPCILTGDAERAQHTLNLLRAASLSRSKSSSRKTTLRTVSREGLLQK